MEAPPSVPDGTGAAMQTDAVRDLARERDHLFLLHEALVDAERATSLEARLDVIVNAIHKIGFGRVVITLRDEQLNQTKLVTFGLTVDDVRELRDKPASGIVWKRRLASLEKFRISQSFYLDAQDEWIAREFHGGLPSRLEESADKEWNPRDALLVPLKGSDGRIIATLVLDDPSDRRRPSLARVRTVELFGQQVAYMIEQAELVEIARRRADRLARLHEVGVILARSLDEDDIIEEMARQIGRVVQCDGIVIAAPDVEENFVTTAFRSVRGVRRQRAPQPLGHGPIGEVARTGGTVRVNDYDPNKSSLAAQDDTVGDGGPARSLLAVPMLVGAKLIGVIAVYVARPNAYGSEDEEVLHTMAAQSATAIINARHYADSQREQRAGEALADVARAVSESLRLAQVLPLILRHATALLRTEGACLSLYVDDELETVAASGCAKPLEGMRIPMSESLSGRALQQNTTIISNETEQDPRAYGPCTEAAAIQRMVIAPLHSKDGPIGALSVINREADFTEADARVLHRLAEQVAVAVVNARLFEEVAKLAERHRRVVETANDAIIITDLNRRISFANPAAEGLLGRPQLVGTLVSEMIAPELREEVRERENRAFAGDPQRYEAVIVRPDGERRSLSISTAPLRELGEVTGSVASIRDVTVERRVRDAMAFSEARYRNLVESASDAIYTMDTRGALTSANQATCDLTGQGRETLLGRSALTMIAPDDVDVVRHHFRLSLAGEAQRYECRFATPGAEERLLSVTNTPIRHGSAVVGVLGVARDVTAERARAEALERSEARYERLVESAADAIFTLDTEMRFTSVNRALEDATGRDRARLIGVSAMVICDPRDCETMREVLAVALQGERRRVEVRYVGPGGEARPGSLIVAPILERGTVVGALGIIRDVTDEKRLVEELLQKEKLAAIGQLVSGVAHELNNPLAGMMAFSQLLLTQPTVDENQRRALASIDVEARRAAKIVNNLLAFARRHQPEQQATDVNQILRDTLELRSYALRVQQIDVALLLDEAAPVTWADPFQLQQVFLNLLSNAEQALEGWSGTRRIDMRTRWRDDIIEIRICDTGPGIPEDERADIFNPFLTARPVGKAASLGLSISAGIIREHGGEILVTSEPGAGAAFTIVLPFVAPPLQKIEPERPVLPTPAQRRVLVVDDEPALRSALALFLRSLGHHVDVAGSGADALAAAGSARYDAILLDMRMPDMPGDAVYDELARRDPDQAARVVFVSGDVHSDAVRSLLARTGRTCISKPFILEDVASSLFSELS
jgi:PAS domain S-box-containing protein